MVTTKRAKWFTNKTLTKLNFHGFGRARKRAIEQPRDSSQEIFCQHESKDSFQEIFRRLDSDGDGRISSDELRSFLGWTGDHVLPEKATIVVRDLDVDDDGFIDYYNFVQLVDGGRRQGVGRGGEDYEEDIRRAFEMFEGEDEGEGCITPKGLQKVFGRLGEEKTQDECAAMIRVYDLDGNGVLDYHEFYRMMG
ncbi:probable calcium-binding protein CML41 [Phalaenopsis equestris]|uniref:probable calcium-binding protein CML41 n=1 Tax=Phalaenopsis equestris TaxID=78828 RepID=UPI0009E2D8B5|nr:probable calcium-binding protein CML41 [Phalaenopsis equestris]